MTLRLISSSFAGTSRNEVAVGTERLASMLATMRAPTPRMGSPGGASSAAGAGADAGAGAVGAAGAGAGATAPLVGAAGGAGAGAGAGAAATGAGRPGGR